jgi:uncharacterized protein YqeY
MFEAYTAINCSYCGQVILGCKEHACYNINNYKKENMKDKIIRSYMQARKDRDTLKADLFSLVVSDIKLSEKENECEIHDSKIIDILNKLLKGIRDSLKHRVTEKSELEEALILSLLPKQLTVEEIKEIMNVEQLLSMRDLMPHLKRCYLGRYDPVVVQSIFKM